MLEKPEIIFKKRETSIKQNRHKNRNKMKIGKRRIEKNKKMKQTQTEKKQNQKIIKKEWKYMKQGKGNTIN